MALTRAFLKSMTLTDEQISAIIEEHSATVTGLKSEISKYKEDAEKVLDLQKKLRKKPHTKRCLKIPACPVK